VDGQRIWAHRLVLAARSKYFRAMLYGEMIEAGQNEITLQDTHFGAFKAILSYIYTGTVRLEAMNDDSLRQLVRMANKYLFKPLEIEVSDYLSFSSHRKTFEWLNRKSSVNINKEDGVGGVEIIVRGDQASAELFSESEWRDLIELLCHGGCKVHSFRIGYTDIAGWSLASYAWYVGQAGAIVDTLLKAASSEVNADPEKGGLVSHITLIIPPKSGSAVSAVSDQYKPRRNCWYFNESDDWVLVSKAGTGGRFLIRLATAEEGLTYFQMSRISN